MKKLLSRILVVMMILSTMVPAVSFADDIQLENVPNMNSEFVSGTGEAETINDPLTIPTVPQGDSANDEFLDNDGIHGQEDTNTMQRATMSQVGPISSAKMAAPLENNIKLTVELGGIAILNGHEYAPGTYDINATVGDVIAAYSNAGYKCKKNDNTYIVEEGKNITVKFKEVDDVYGKPAYVTNGYFSGYNKAGVDISGHDPKEDVLSATMTTARDKSRYALGDIATVTLNVDVTDGDGETEELVEVDFYENNANSQTFSHVSTATPVTFTTTIPDSETELTGAGFVLTTDPVYKTYTKSLNYNLVDRYNFDGAAAIVAKASTKLVIKIKATNLWVAADDHSEVYINGTSVTNNIYGQTYYSQVQEYIVVAPENTFVAAQGWDTGNVIAGFKLVLTQANGTNLVTNDQWYYYTGTTTPPPFGETQWFQENYIGEGWEQVTKISNPNAAWTALFPVGNPDWIWSPEYEGTIKTPVYLRSMAPAPIPTMGAITVSKDVINKDGTDATDDTTFNFTYILQESEIVTSGAGMVAEGSPTSLDLPFGTYTFTETEPGGLYTDITTGGSVTVTIDENNPTATVLFVNQLEKDDPVDPENPETPDNPGTPTTPRNTPRTTPVQDPVLTPIIDEPVALAPAPEFVLEDGPVALADDPNVPQTSDSNNILLLLGLLLSSGTGMAVLGRRKKTEAK